MILFQVVVCELFTSTENAWVTRDVCYLEEQG